MSLANLPPRGSAHAPVAAALCDIGERLTGILASERRFSQSPMIDRHARRRIEAVIAGLIEALDELDGEADREQTATETRGAGFRLDPIADDAEDGHDREAITDDSGFGDWQGRDERAEGCSKFWSPAQSVVVEIPGPADLQTNGGPAARRGLL